LAAWPAAAVAAFIAIPLARRAIAAIVAVPGRNASRKHRIAQFMQRSRRARKIKQLSRDQPCRRGVAVASTKESRCTNPAFC
jgi:hypothetical protein